MVLSRLDAPTKSLRLFFPGQDSELDFRKTRCLDYVCSLEKPSKSELTKKMDIEGAPRSQAWKEGKNLELPFGDHGGRCLGHLNPFLYISGYQKCAERLMLFTRLHDHEFYGSAYPLESFVFRRCPQGLFERYLKDSFA